MNILWFSWKDASHPLAGGAEIVGQELAKRLAKDGHSVIFIVGGYKGCKHISVENGYKIIRVGNRFTLYIQAAWYYLKYLRTWPDLIIEEINTVPFFTQLYSHKKRLLFFHQLCREIWFYEFPFPVSILGYVVEPLYLRFLSTHNTICVSKSTKQDLQKYGFKSNKIHVITEGINLVPLDTFDKAKKSNAFTVLSFGTMRSMKQTLDQIKAFEIIKDEIPSAQMVVAGNSSGRYGKKVLEYISKSPCKKAIRYVGRVNHKQKSELMQQSHALLVTSVKEGWCLVITEANSQGTPSVAYDVEGVRDSIKAGISGILTKQNSYTELAQEVVRLYHNKKLYNELGSEALKLSKMCNYDASYKDFLSIILNHVR